MFSRSRNDSKHSAGTHRSRLSARRTGYAPGIEALEERRLLTAMSCQSPELAAETSEVGKAISTTESAQVSTASITSGKVGKGGKPPSAGISVSTTPTFSSPGLMITTERGGTAEFRVVLESQPTADVTINLTSSDSSEGTTDVPSLVFTPNNWNTPRAVRVTGVDDLDPDGTVAYSIITQPAISTDPNYNSLDAADVAIYNIDDDSPVTNAIYVRGFELETRKKGPSTEIRLGIDVRHDTDADGVSEDSDLPAAGVVVVISIYDSIGTNVRNLVGTTSAQGTGTTAWYKLPGTGDYHIEVHDLSLAGFHWDPLNELESGFGDQDGDGRPDLQLTV